MTVTASLGFSNGVEIIATVEANDLLSLQTVTLVCDYQRSPEPGWPHGSGPSTQNDPPRGAATIRAGTVLTLLSPEAAALVEAGAATLN